VEAVYYSETSVRWHEVVLLNAKSGVEGCSTIKLGSSAEAVEAVPRYMSEHIRPDTGKGSCPVSGKRAANDCGHVEAARMLAFIYLFLYFFFNFQGHVMA
jgi:hypothetical protein